MIRGVVTEIHAFRALVDQEWLQIMLFLVPVRPQSIIRIVVAH